MKISIQDVKQGQVVRVPSIIVSKWGDNNGRSYGYGPYTWVAQEVLLVKLDTYPGSSYIACSYAVEGDVHTKGITLPLDYVFECLDEAQQDKVKASYNKNVEANLEKNIGNTMTTIGSDPEIFVEDDKGNVMPAFLFLGSKQAPTSIPVANYQPKNDAYWDGFQAEFTTYATHCISQHCDSIRRGLKVVLDNARKQDKKATLSTKTVMNVSQEQLESAKEEHVTFGCMPSFNAYQMKGLAMSGREVPFRPAGGHIHFGCKKHTPEHFTTIVKTLDAILGVACVSLFAKYDDPRRRQLYGLAGEFRLPPHGMEYRVLSNAWLIHPMLVNLVFDLARKSFTIGDKGFRHLWKAEESEVIEVINACNVEGAQKILTRNKDMLIKIFEGTYTASYAGARAVPAPTGHVKKEQLEHIFNIFMNGIDAVIENPNDFVKNWKLDGEWGDHCDRDRLDVTYLLPTIISGKKVA